MRASRKSRCLTALTATAGLCCVGSQCCPQGESLVQNWNASTRYEVSVAANGITCTDSAGRELLIRPLHRYSIVAVGGVIGTGDLLAPHANPWGVASTAPADFPSPGQSRYSLVLKVEGWRRWYYAGAGFPTFADFEVEQPAKLCFAVNDNVPGDNTGAFAVHLQEQGFSLTCSGRAGDPLPGAPIPNIPGGACSGTGAKCKDSNTCCSKQCTSGICGGASMPPAPTTMIDQGTFSCTGTVTINGQDCANELGDATTCQRHNGAISCPAIRAGCTCTCSLGDCG